jgi:hypothetical protein
LESTEDEIARGVGAIASALTERANPEDQLRHPSLRAMCMSFMMIGLQAHVLAQSYALRMLLGFAKGTDLCQNARFVRWILRFMQSRIDSMIGIKEKQELFVRVCVEFFQAIPNYDSNCVLAVLKFFGSQEFTRVLDNPGKWKSALQEIATATLNAALTQHREFFLFEIIRDTVVIHNNLVPRQQELLKIFVEKTIADFNAFLETGGRDYIVEQKLDLETLRFNIQVLTFCTICHGHTEMGLADLGQQFGLDSLALKKLLVSINRTNVAKTQIDAVRGNVTIEYCQPRTFTPETWVDMDVRLGRVIESLETTSRAFDAY